MRELRPSVALARLAQALPPSVRENVTVIGSVAAGFHFESENAPTEVRTKDIDCVLAPYLKAVGAGTQIAAELIAHGWRPSLERPPGNAVTPDNELPVIRLYPPTGEDWFVELLGVPLAPGVPGTSWSRISLKSGDFGLPSFPYLGIATHRPTVTDWGISCGRVEMMALAHLLEHPELTPQLISKQIDDRKIKRCNKDLGRVLALAYLTPEREMESWPTQWIEALQSVLGAGWQEAANRVPHGVRALLESSEELEQAWFANNVGLLAGRGVSLEATGVAGERLMADVVSRFSEMAVGASRGYGGRRNVGDP